LTTLNPKNVVGKSSFYNGDCRKILPRLDIPDSAGYLIDPDWNNYDMVKSLKLPTRFIAFCDAQYQRDVYKLFGAPLWIFTWDCITSWYVNNRPLRRVKFAFWYGNDYSEYDFNGSHFGNSGKSKTVTNPRSTYQFNPDPRGKHLSDLFRYPITKRGDVVNYEKPLDWIRMLIANCLGDCSVIVDPFAGSGVGARACIQLDIASISIELDSERYKNIVSLAQSVPKMLANNRLHPDVGDSPAQQSLFTPEAGSAEGKSPKPAPRR